MSESQVAWPQIPKAARTVSGSIASILPNALNVIQVGIALDLLGLSVILDDKPAFKASAAFGWMAAHGTETHWAEIISVVSLLGLAGALFSNRRVRALSAFVTGTLTGILSWSYYISNPNGAGWLPYAVLTLFGYFLMAHRLFSHE